MAQINLLEDYYTVDTSQGVISPRVPIPNGASKFELWYKINNYVYNPSKSSQITLTFKSSESSNTTGFTYYPAFYLIVNENTDWVCVTFELPRTVIELGWITLNGEYQVTWEMFYEDVAVAEVKIDKGLATNNATGAIYVTPSTAEDSALLTTSKNLTGAINEVFQFATTFQEALALFKASIISKGGNVANLTIESINEGILNIPVTGGSGSSSILYESDYDGTSTWTNGTLVVSNVALARSVYGVIINSSNSYLSFNNYAMPLNYTIVIKLRLMSVSSNGSFLSIGTTNFDNRPSLLLQNNDGKLRYYTDGGYKYTDIYLATSTEYIISITSGGFITFNGVALLNNTYAIFGNRKIWLGVGYLTPMAVEVASIEIRNYIE